MNLFRRWGLLALPLLALLASCSYLPDSGAVSGVTVTDKRSYILLSPSSGSYASLGFMFIPGALVDPHSYDEALSKVATQGYAVVIVKEPANLAILNAAASLSLVDDISGISSWAIGGHSLGGTMASEMVKQHPDTFKGLILEASYPASYDSLADWSGKVLSISASNDGLATPAKIEANKQYLPTSTTTYETISGGCHAYFGSSNTGQRFDPGIGKARWRGPRASGFELSNGFLLAEHGLA